jgi:hypothetical protein
MTLGKTCAFALSALALSPLLAACSSLSTNDTGVALSGAQEVPPVQTAASGKGSIRVAQDGTVSGRIGTTGITGTQAHIHTGARGVNGPIIIPLTRDGDNGWSVPTGAKLSPEQFNSFRGGNLYVNVHTTAHPGGEIRGQLQPNVSAPNTSGY